MDDGGAAVKVPSPRTTQTEEVAKSLPTYVPNTPGRRDHAVRTPRQRTDSEKVRFYPVTKDSTKPPDPQVIQTICVLMM